MNAHLINYDMYVSKKYKYRFYKDNQLIMIRGRRGGGYLR
jgi:hypothetical protein